MPPCPAPGTSGLSGLKSAYSGPISIADLDSDDDDDKPIATIPNLLLLTYCYYSNTDMAAVLYVCNDRSAGVTSCDYRDHDSSCLRSISFWRMNFTESQEDSVLFKVSQYTKDNTWLINIECKQLFHWRRYRQRLSFSKSGELRLASEKNSSFQVQLPSCP